MDLKITPNLKFLQKEGFQIFFIKREDLEKKGGVITYFHTNPFQYFLSLSVLCGCVSFVYLHRYYQYSFCLTGRALVLLNLTDIWLLQVINFWKAKANFWYQQITQCNTNSCSEHITGGVNISIRVCHSIGPWVCCVSLFVSSRWTI